MEKKKNNRIAVIIVAIIIIAAAAVAVYFILSNQSQKKSAAKSANTSTESATEYVITSCDEEDEKLFPEAIIGSWSSYTKDGVAYSYSFDKDGGVRYTKDGEDPADYTYTFGDGYLTIKTDKKSFVYQLSPDAAGMMARMKYGEWNRLFAAEAEKTPDFNGCVYIVDDIMYFGSVCLCRSDRLDAGDNDSLVGDWIGASGDTLTFSSDGSYTYVENAEKYNGDYTVDYDSNELTLTLGDTTTKSTEGMWGLNGRVFNIGKQYYFKLI
jgi:hypothetical protein